MPGFFSRWFGRPDRSKPREPDARDVTALARSLATPAVHLIAADSPSRSHFGGASNLPSGVAWPERAGTPLTFLMRVSLADVQRAHRIDWLPDSGALLVFYDVDNQPWGFDPKDRGGWAVLLVPDRVAPVTAAAESPGPTLPFCPIDLRPIEVLPSSERGEVRALNLSDAEQEAYDELAFGVHGDLPKHQVGGYPVPVQGDDMELESQLASSGIYCGTTIDPADPRTAQLTSGAAGWRLLLQIDSDDRIEAMWGDAGTLYLWVEADAARHGRFDNVWLILQCS